jgi:hypothetical protein
LPLVSLLRDVPSGALMLPPDTASTKTPWFAATCWSIRASATSCRGKNFSIDIAIGAAMTGTIRETLLARAEDGFHLYANDHWAKHPSDMSVQFLPWEVNYAKDIPGAFVVGAYDAPDNFIPNPDYLGAFK